MGAGHGGGHDALYRLCAVRAGPAGDAGRDSWCARRAHHDAAWLCLPGAVRRVTALYCNKSTAAQCSVQCGTCLALYTALHRAPAATPPGALAVTARYGTDLCGRHLNPQAPPPPPPAQTPGRRLAGSAAAGAAAAARRHRAALLHWWVSVGGDGGQGWSGALRALLRYPPLRTHPRPPTPHPRGSGIPHIVSAFPKPQSPTPRAHAALADEPPGVRAAVQESVGSLSRAFVRQAGPAAAADDRRLREIDALLLTSITSHKVGQMDRWAGGWMRGWVGGGWVGDQRLRGGGGSATAGQQQHQPHRGAGKLRAC